VAKKKKDWPLLYSAWLRAEEYIYGLNEAKAVACLNAMTGMNYLPNRIYEWKNKVRDIPQTARAHMIQRTLRCQLHEHGIKAKQDACDLIAKTLGG